MIVVAAANSDDSAVASRVSYSSCIVVVWKLSVVFWARTGGRKPAFSDSIFRNHRWCSDNPRFRSTPRIIYWSYGFCSQSPIFPWDRRCWVIYHPFSQFFRPSTPPPQRCLKHRLDPRAICTLPSFARIKRPRWRPMELNDRHLRSHGRNRGLWIVHVLGATSEYPATSFTCVGVL